MTLTMKRVSKTFQGSHRLEKYLNIQVCLEKALKIKFALKVLEKPSKSLELYNLQVSTFSLYLFV